jgi:hypothetical protein
MLKAPGIAHRHRRRLASVIAVAAVLVVGLEFWKGHPRETEIRLALDDRHGSVVALDLRFIQNDEEMRGLRLTFPHGAPRLVPCAVDLSPGRYRVALELRLRDGRRTRRERALTVPADAPVRFEVALPGVAREKPGPEQQH